MTSAFDPALFLTANITEPTVRRPMIPATLNVKGTIGAPKPAGGSRDDGAPWLRFDIPIELDLSSNGDAFAAVNAENKGDPVTTVTLTDRVFVDLNAAGMIDNGIGKNRKMRNYREATGQNEVGQPFNFLMLQGRPVLVKIKHREHEGVLYEDIDSVAKA
jgi:hypothetical protein